MSEKLAAAQRIHSEAPAEGDLDADPTDLRMHSQDPAEGIDTEGADTEVADAGELAQDK
ncbi:hypothetical protein QFZ30_000201 [Arthrobacter pascens]|uniref:hypothetical protein n=1 Tax=Arthrobacter pascens TaxID=1677 RepID=UPI00278DDA3F|nr:hypothetical protein [Arthrobacter pascens]MDQ0676819.1 hypothetical protein [Arthrobacter pascens]